MNLDETYWSARYINNETGWDIGGVSLPLKEYFDQLKNKDIHVLIPGAGNAYEAEYLVKNGFKNVYVCDVAEEPLLNLKNRCPQIDPSHILRKDFFEIQNLQFDLIVEQTFFCALDPSLRKKYFEKIHAFLKPGGKLVGLLFNDKLNNDKPPFGGSRDEYMNYFMELFRVKVCDTCYNSIEPRAGRELFINLEK